MQNVPLVQALNSDSNLNDNSLSLCFVQRLHWLLHKIIKEVSTRHEFGDDEEILRVLERLDVFEYVDTALFSALAQDL